MSRRDTIRSALSLVCQTQGEDWTYRRGGASGTIRLVPSRAVYDQEDGGEAVAQTRTRYDVLLMAAGLLIGTPPAAVTPRPGDTLTDGGMTLEVVADETTACFDFVGPYRDCLRIHCQRK